MNRNEHSPVRIRPTKKIFKGFPNLFPYLSMFFILLFFFMIGTNFVPVQGIPVTLPHASGDFTYASKNLIVTVDQHADIYFNDTRIDHTDKDLLKRRIADARTGYSTKGKRTRENLIIRLDVKAPQDRLMMLLSIAKEMDLNVIIMTNQQDEQSKVTKFREE